jgi:hypothetical protein
MSELNLQRLDEGFEFPVGTDVVAVVSCEPILNLLFNAVKLVRLVIADLTFGGDFLTCALELQCLFQRFLVRWFSHT